MSGAGWRQLGDAPLILSDLNLAYNAYGGYQALLGHFAQGSAKTGPLGGLRSGCRVKKPCGDGEAGHDRHSRIFSLPCAFVCDHTMHSRRMRRPTGQELLCSSVNRRL